MGNEASLEGGEGPPSGLPEGLAPDGKGGFVRVSDGTPVDLSQLSQEQRRQLAAAMGRGGGGGARRQGLCFAYSDDDGERDVMVCVYVWSILGKGPF